jgi:hypothetical protein
MSKLDRRFAFLEGHAHFGHVLAAEDADRRFAIAREALLRHRLLAVEEALHVRQESDELAVMALVELFGVAAEFVGQFAPRVVGVLFQQLIVMLERAVFG